MPYQRMIFEAVHPTNQSYSDIPYKLTEAFGNVWKEYKAKEVKSKVFWSEVSAPGSAQELCQALIGSVKRTNKAGLKWRLNGGLDEIYVDAPPHQIVVGRVRDGANSFGPAAGGIASRLDNDKEFVLDGWDQNVPRYVYRSVSDTDVSNIRNDMGISPKSTSATDTITEHVCGRELTHWISATRSREDVANAHGQGFGTRRVKIDLSVIAKARIYDLSTPLAEIRLMREMSGKPGKPSTYSSTAQQAFKDAKRTKEVLIEGTIPQGAIAERINFT